MLSVDGLYYPERLFDYLENVGVELTEEQKEKVREYEEFISEVDDLSGRDKKYARLHFKSDEELFDLAERGFCVECDYSGTCRCYMAQEVLSYRGYDMKSGDDEVDPVPPPIESKFIKTNVKKDG